MLGEVLSPEMIKIIIGDIQPKTEEMIDKAWWIAITNDLFLVKTA